jgi:hypothetical protein
MSGTVIGILRQVPGCATSAQTRTGGNRELSVHVGSREGEGIRFLGNDVAQFLAIALRGMR